MIKKGTNQNIYKHDIVVTFIIFIFVFVVSLTGIDKGHHWGDDFAAYILERISIVEGTFDEQVEQNTILHPSSNLRDGAEERLVYSWGYPLLLALVYYICGYDIENENMLIYYKLPGVIALAILWAVLYWFYRRRFSKILSFVLMIVFCCNYNMLTKEII